MYYSSMAMITLYFACQIPLIPGIYKETLVPSCQGHSVVALILGLAIVSISCGASNIHCHQWHTLSGPIIHALLRPSPPGLS